MTSDDLDQFVAECDRLGGPQHPDAAGFLAGFRLTVRTEVNERLDPFGAEYFAQQLALYTELSGRDLDQDSGELLPIDVDTHAAAANPYASPDAAFIARHVRAILSTLMIAKIPHGGAVLDLGCGWGLSSETIAYCGARVTAVDINPQFVELVGKRAARLGLPISAVQSNFDDFASEERFDLILFYECLHHSVRPWTTLQHVARFVGPGGKIAFAGEPINDRWRTWGLRLDPLSVYCIHKYGWFESGWSAAFLTSIFDRAGFALTLYPGVGLDNAPLGIAHRRNEAVELDLTITAPMRAQAVVNAITSSRAWRATGRVRALASALRPGRR